MTIELEPNNSIESAFLLPIESTATGSISTSSDLDYYAISVTETGVLSVAFDAPPAPLLSRFKVNIFDAAGNILSGYVADTDFNIHAEVTAPGNYYVSVSPEYEGYFDPGQYSITATMGSGQASSEIESNDTQANANTLTLNTPVAGNISTLSDHDFYVVPIDTPGVLTFDLKMPQGIYYEGDMRFSRFDAYVFDPSGNLLAVASPHFDLTLTLTASVSGTYYLYLANSSGISNSGQYLLSVTETLGSEMAYESEPNDSPAIANILFPGEVVNGYLPYVSGVSGSYLDDDYYEVTLLAAGVLTVNFEKPSDTNLQYVSAASISVLDASGNVLAGSEVTTPGVPVSFEVGIPSPGSYHVAVKGAGNGAYSLSVSETAGGNETYESEPNNSAASADALLLGATILGQLSSTDDVDHYAIVVTDTGVLSANFSALPSDAFSSFFSLSVYDGNGVLKASRFADQNASIAFGVLESGTYDIVVGGNSHWQYELSVSQIEGNPGAFEQETNDSVATANAVSLGATEYGQLSSNSDSDYFSVTLAEAGIIHVAFDSPTALDLVDFFRVSIFDTEGNSLTWRQSGQDMTLDAGALTAGTYYVSIGPAISYGAPFTNSGQYSFVVSEVNGDPSVFEQDPNDTRSSANPMMLDSAKTGHLSSTTDADYYAIDLPSTGVLTVSFHTPTQGAMGDNFIVSVLDDTGTVLAAQQTGQDFNFSVGAYTSGTYYVSVTTAAYLTLDSGNYSISASAVAGGSSAYEHEQNNSIGTANTLEMGSSVIGQLFSRGDGDYYAISVEASGVLSVAFDSPTSNPWFLHTYFGVWLLDSAGNVVAQQDSGQDFSFDTIVSPGNYYLAVAAAAYDDSGAYTLSVSEDTSAPAYESSNNNDSLQSAASLELGTPVTAHVGDAYDGKDCFSFSVESGGLFSIALDLLAGDSSFNSFNVGLYDASGNLNAIWDWYQTENSGQVTITTPGTYYVIVVPRSNAQEFGLVDTSGYLYDLAVDQVTTGMDDDFFGAVDTEGNLELSGSATGSINTQGDSDWFRVHLDAGDTYIFSATAVEDSWANKGYGLNLGLRFSDGTLLETVDSLVLFPSEESQNRELAFTAPSSGTYFLSVDGTPFDNSTNPSKLFQSQDYVLEVTQAPLQDSVDAILSGYSWTPDSPLPHSTTLTYSFPTGLPFEYSSFYASEGIPAPTYSAFTNAQKADVRSILNSWSDVANVTFTETTGNNGQIRFGWVTEDPYILGDAAAITYWDIPSDTSTQITRADVFVDSNYFSPAQDPSAGDYLYLALLHEIGHGLSLDHSGNYLDGSPPPYLTAALDNTEFTVMSYFDAATPSIYSSVPALFDIATVQYLFGANNSTRTGNDVYSYPTGSEYFTTLWDAGGTDTLDASGQALAASIFLEGGTFSSIGTTTTGTVAHDNVAIAFGVQIENAKGGSGDDLIIGNAAANGLIGNVGDDTLVGGAGNDTLDGGVGADIVRYTGNRSGYSLSLSSGTYTVTDIDSNDGDDGTDTLTGIEIFAFADVTMSLGSNNAPTGSIGIAGSATQGQTLSAGSTLADLDGLGAVGYQWQGSSDGSTWNNLGTGASLFLTQAQVGQQIRLVAGYTDGFGTQESVTSSATAVVANTNDAPSGRVTINGVAMQGQTLIASNALADADGLDTINYQWNVDGIPIAGATEGSFALGEAQVSRTITVTAHYTDGQGTAESVTSDAIIVEMALSAKYFITDQRGSYIDWSARIQDSSLLGKGVQVVGGAGDDTIYIQGGASASVANLGGGVNALYLTGNLADYAQTISQETGVYTLTRIAGLLEGQAERVKFTVGDKSDVVYFADGHITIDAASDSRLYDGTSFHPIEAAWLTAGTTPASAVTTEATIATNPAKVFIVDAEGLDVPMLMQPGQSMIVTGSGAADTVYINAGTSVDATNLGGGADRLYFMGNLIDYSQTIGQETGIYTLSRSANGQNEVVQFTVSDQDDIVYFADGHITVNASADSRFFIANPVAVEFQPIQSDWLTPGGATLAALLNLGASSMPSVDFMQMNIA